ncbi:MAG: hypothetical protein ACI9UJ_002061 [bacterium]|jgi:hypothetical protein
MVRYWRNIFLFLLPLVIAIALLPESDKLRYAGLKAECSGKSEWMHNRIAINPKPIDVAYIGSSHVINGIEDAIIMRKQANAEQVVNFGFCRLGRDLQYQIIKDITAGHALRTIVLEVREFENKSSHPVFPFIGTTKNVLGANIVHNPKYLPNVFQHLSYKTQLTQDLLYNDSNSTFKFRDTGFPEWVETRKLDSNLYPVCRNETLLVNTTFPKFSRHYLQLISDLCYSKGISFKFIYLPSFNSNAIPVHMEVYESFGTVFIVPDSIMRNPNNWFDVQHFNHYGATKVSEWLADQDI